MHRVTSTQWARMLGRGRSKPRDILDSSKAFAVYAAEAFFYLHSRLQLVMVK